MIALGQVRTGTKILFRGAPHEVIEANHLKMGRGGAKLNTKLRNLIDQAVIDYTFAGEERLEEAEISYKAAQFLYRDEQDCFFMINDSFEQVSMPLPKHSTRFLKEGGLVDLVFWQDQAIGAKLPKKVELEVSYTEPAHRGNTVSAATKSATLETEDTVQVPLFINTGDMIRVNTETGAYDSRV